MDISNPPIQNNSESYERLFRTLIMIKFLIYFQAYMIPPIIPYLSTLFQVSPQIIGLTVPCYMIPYGISSLIFGYLSDRFGRKSIMVFSLFWVTILSLLTATTQSVTQLLLWRFFTGALASGTIPQSLTLIKECFSTEQQGRRLGWVEMGKFDPSCIYSMQLMQTKFEYDGSLNPKFSPGLFRLDVNNIKAYGRKVNTPQFILISSAGVTRPGRSDINLEDSIYGSD